MTRFHSCEELLSVAEHKEHIGPWVEVSQSMIDGFADVTGDHQWIHVDPVRASEGPFGQTIAHGFLSLSLLPHLIEGSLVVDGLVMRINYGLESVRFTDVVPSGSLLRARSKVATAQRTGSGVRVELDVIVEARGRAKAVLRARQILLLVEGAA